MMDNINQVTAEAILTSFSTAVYWVVLVLSSMLEQNSVVRLNFSSRKIPFRILNHSFPGDNSV